MNSDWSSIRRATAKLKALRVMSCALRRKQIALLVSLLVLALSFNSARAQGSAFTYQGRLSDGALPANGTYDLCFKLYDTLTDGNLVGSPNTVTLNNPGVLVTNGIFSVQLNFDQSAFPGADRYLEISVRPHSSDPNTPLYTTLTPRQLLTASPYAMRSANATTADSVRGIVAPANGGTGLNLGPTSDGQFLRSSGAGAWSISLLTANDIPSLDAGKIGSGVLPIARGGTGASTQNFVDLTTNQTIGGNKNFSGVLSGDGSGLRNVSGANIAGSTALNPQRLALQRWYDVNRATAAQPITVGSQPLALTFDGTFIYVANGGTNTVSRIRAATGVVEGSPITVGSGPHGLAFDGTYVYVANGNDDTVTRIRAATGAVVGSPIAVGNAPASLVFDGTFVDVVAATDTKVNRIRAATGLVEGSPIQVGANPNGIAFDGTFVYVANSGANTVTRIRAATGLVEGPAIPVGTNPQGLTFDGTFIYVSNAGSNNVTRIRVSTGVVEGSPIAVGPSPWGLAFDGTFVWVTNFNAAQVTRIRASTGIVEGDSISVGSLPLALAFDGAFVYVANAGSNSVMRF